MNFNGDNPFAMPHYRPMGDEPFSEDVSGSDVEARPAEHDDLPEDEAVDTDYDPYGDPRVYPGGLQLGFPTGGYPGGGYPGGGYQGGDFGDQGYPGGGYPGAGFQGQGYPGGFQGQGYPGGGYPGGGFPGQGYPGGGNPDGYPGGGGQQAGGAPSSPPPSFVPQETSATALAVDPGGIRRCMYRYTYLWLTSGSSFWFYPVYVGRTSVAGYRWRRRYGWVYFGIDLNRIRSFQCY
nr:hypothetical protein [Bacillus sp. T33-2]